MKTHFHLLTCGLLLLSAEPGSAQSRSAQRFKQADKNGDGKLSKAEVSPKLWERIRKYDADGDGRLNQRELAASGAGGDKSGKRPGGANTSFDVKTFQRSGGHPISYSLFSPKKEAGKLPLVVCLHGVGGSTQAANVAASRKIQDQNPCFVMAPACNPKLARWVARSMRGNKSYRSVMPELMEAIDDLVTRLPIDPRRIYITGQSMGGVGTWGTISTHPNRFAAAAPVCGMWPTENAAKLKHLPIWAFHGEKDTTVPVKGSRDMVAAIKQAGGSPKYTEFPGVGHGSWRPAYELDEFWTWLFRQSRNPEQSPSEY
jgi:predicted esterase